MFMSLGYLKLTTALCCHKTISLVCTDKTTVYHLKMKHTNILWRISPEYCRKDTWACSLASQHHTHCATLLSTDINSRKCSEISISSMPCLHAKFSSVNGCCHIGHMPSPGISGLQLINMISQFCVKNGVVICNVIRDKQFHRSFFIRNLGALLI